MLAVISGRIYYAIILWRWNSVGSEALTTALGALAPTRSGLAAWERNALVFSIGSCRVSLSEVDRQLLQRCLDRAPRAWQDFVDRFLGLVIHVANHTAEARGVSVDGATRDDLVADVFLAIISNDFAVLRRFRRNCSLATYLTVISRRVIVRKLMQAQKSPPPTGRADQPSEPSPARIENREEVQRLLLRLDPNEANVVRMYHLEGKSYEEIGRVVGMSANSIGPVLSRARNKMRNGSDRSG